MDAHGDKIDPKVVGELANKYGAAPVFFGMDGGDEAVVEALLSEGDKLGCHKHIHVEGLGGVTGNAAWLQDEWLRVTKLTIFTTRERHMERLWRIRILIAQFS